MTCIAALVHKGTVYMAADSAGIAGYELSVRRDPKIYRVGEFLFGSTSSFRMGQLLGYKFIPPPHHPDIPIERYMNVPFIDSLRMVLKDGGYTKIDSNKEQAGTFLVGYRGRLFLVDSDFQVGESLAPWDACGCGAAVALGSLFSTEQYQPERRLELALQAAERYSAGVRGPFIFEKTPGAKQ